MGAIEHILRLAGLYQAHLRLSEQRASGRIFGDRKKLGALRADGDIQVKRAEATIRWFSANWPADLTWPIDIERKPAVQEAA